MSRKDHPNNAPGIPMVFPVWFENFQIKYFNPLVKPIARYLPTFSVIKHRGRTSGKPYETIVTAYRKGNVLAIGLAHGKTDWVKNVFVRRRSRSALHPQGRSHHQPAGPARRKRRQRPALPGAPADRAGRGLRRRYRLDPRVKTVLPLMVGQTSGASSQSTTRSTTGNRSHPRANTSRISGITARALTRPVTNRTPRVYIGSSGISTRRRVVDPGVGAHTVRPGGPQRRSQHRGVGGGVHGDGIGLPGFVWLGPVVHDGTE